MVVAGSPAESLAMVGGKWFEPTDLSNSFGRCFVRGWWMGSVEVDYFMLDVEEDMRLLGCLVWRGTCDGYDVCAV